MGIDKPDVRFVIHYSLPKSLEAYYQVSDAAGSSLMTSLNALVALQETGRAGRDGDRSTCVMFYSYSDTKLINSLINEGSGSADQKEANRDSLRNMVRYCLNETSCRKLQVLQYLGDDHFSARDCRRTCDNCSASPVKQTRDVTLLAQDAVRLLMSLQTEARITLLHVVDVFRGSLEAAVSVLPLSAPPTLTRRLIKQLLAMQITSKNHHKLPHAGKGKLMDRLSVARLFHLLATQRAVEERYERNSRGYLLAYATLGPNAARILEKGYSLEMVLVAAAPRTVVKGATSTPPTSEALLDQLLKLRHQVHSCFSTLVLCSRRKG